MRKKKLHYIVPPKKSIIHRVINGTDTKLTIIRDSWLCRVLQRPTLSLWTRIYVRSSILSKKVFDEELDKLRQQHEDGWVKSIWCLLSGKS